jgi:hypothetical protein
MLLLDGHFFYWKSILKIGKTASPAIRAKADQIAKADIS